MPESIAHSTLSSAAYPAPRTQLRVTTARVAPTGTAAKPGFTDGFYVGSPQPLSRVLRRLDDDSLWRDPGAYDYEQQLRRCIACASPVTSY